MKELYDGDQTKRQIYDDLVKNPKQRNFATRNKSHAKNLQNSMDFLDLSHNSGNNRYNGRKSSSPDKGQKGIITNKHADKITDDIEL